MALDGIYLYSLVQDLKKSIINSKIDKINQPEKDEIFVTLRKDRKNVKLLISASSKYPRIHLTEVNKTNPLQAPMFTMVLRKYLIGGKIIDIEQIDGDRLLNIYIEATDELGFNSVYILIVEIMGRHSNITLVRQRDNKVMECIKHIGADVNSYRVLYPGVTYKYPPKSKKLNPFNFSKTELEDYIKENTISFDTNIFSSIFTGISKPLSHHFYSEYSKLENNINLDCLYNFMKDITNNLANNSKFNITVDSSGNFIDLFSIKLNNIYNEDNSIEFENPNIMMDKFYLIKDKQERIKSRSINIQKLLTTNIDRCLKKEEKLTSLIKKCEGKDDFKIKGDLLTSYIYTIKPGSSSIELLNFYSENEEYMEIALDPNKSPSENVQSYYKKYNKLKKSEESSLEQLEKNEEELQYLYSVLTNIQNCESYIEIDDIKNELISTGYIKNRKTSKNDKKSKASKPLHFVSSEGIDIFVGKNNIQNDYLSLKFANKNYMWLHTKNIPGSHVIICATDIPDKTLIEGATLAAYYSKAQTSSKVPVDYTLVKNLKKPAGSKPGMVIYHTNYTLYAEPSELNSFNLEKK